MIRKIDRHFVESVLLNARLQWEADPDQFLWLRATYEGEWMHIRINPTFPDGPAYLFVLSDGGNFGFDDFPSEWSRGPLKWPDTAKKGS